MIRWAAVIFLGLMIFYPLLPWLDRLFVGRLPGDIRFRLRGVIFCLPFGSTVLWSVVAFVIAGLTR
ncbi:DUF2905 domain-containing protein [Noviherbaspirillum massiliense]|uniref:DUF2905 domain-containing protein n=1 Tax=Noviherbaspirillum massiliense TaxID=1465823 RepID=UPI0003044D3C|nr:DUF2905 domain-containing protein [Noviherbaspirillum massiliense]